MHHCSIDDSPQCCASSNSHSHPKPSHKLKNFRLIWCSPIQTRELNTWPPGHLLCFYFFNAIFEHLIHWTLIMYYVFHFCWKSQLEDNFIVLNSQCILTICYVSFSHLLYCIALWYNLFLLNIEIKQQKIECMLNILPCHHGHQRPVQTACPHYNLPHTYV